MKRLLIWTGILSFSLLFAWGAFGSQWYYESKAEEAIDAVIDACSTGSRLEVARRMVDARAAFRNTGEMALGYDARLNSRMKYIGCSLEH